MRHAKADRPAGVADRERPLTERGRGDARAIGMALSALDPAPGVVATSPARRTLETTEIVLAAAGWSARTYVRDELYRGGVDEVLDLIRATADEVTLIVGHEPTWSATVTALCGGSVHMPTAAVAAIALSDRNRPGGSGSLLWMITPRLARSGSPA